MVKKKSYNPFKMWGSYIGAVVLFIVGGLLSFAYGFACIDCIRDVTTFYSTILPIIMIISGFLLGWGIHSIWRYFKR